MKFTTSCFVRKNTKELRDKLSDIGYQVCTCCINKDSIWLNNLTENGTIHGIGYDYNEPSVNTPKEMTEFFLFENNEYGNKSIDCGENEDLFLALAALQSDSDRDQYFWYKDKLFKCIGGGSTAYINGDHSIKLENGYGFFDVMKSKLKKASIEELINYFDKN